MAISANDVKSLREKTGAGMMDCKKALEECNGNEEAAIKLLKEKGLAAMQKRADRATDEGCIFIAESGNNVAIAELTCETDFVAKNDDFLNCGNKIVEMAAKDKIKEITNEMIELVKDVSVKTRENMNLKRLELVEIPASCIAGTYIHSNKKRGVIAVIKADSNDSSVKEFAEGVCLNVAAYSPLYISKKDVPESYKKEQTEILLARTKEEMPEKPEKVLAGIVQGRLNKQMSEICLMDEMFINDDKKTVEQKMKEVGSAVGSQLNVEKIVSFVM